MPASKVRILVSTSERKRAGGTRAYSFREAQQERAFNRFPSLTEQRRLSLNALLKALNGQGDARRVLGLEGKLLEQVAALDLAFNKNPLMPVIERENGPLYRALDGKTLPAAIRRQLRESMLILCPLLGVLAPSDLVPEYRCPIAAQTRNGVRSMHHAWKDRVTELLNRLCRKRLVYSFLPARVRSLWKWNGTAPRLAQFSFVRRKGSGIRHEHAGAGRFSGELIRHLLIEQIENPLDLTSYVSSAGHAYAPELSEITDRVSTLVFARS